MLQSFDELTLTLWALIHPLLFFPSHNRFFIYIYHGFEGRWFVRFYLYSLKKWLVLLTQNYCTYQSKSILYLFYYTFLSWRISLLTKAFLRPTLTKSIHSFFLPRPQKTGTAIPYVISKYTEFLQTSSQVENKFDQANG